MALGEAFVEIHADLRPFARDLQRNIRPIVQAYERELNRATGSTLLAQSEENGRRIGDRVSRGMRNSLLYQFKNKNVFIAIASALGGALDDGISALPTEVKAAIVAGILASLPVIGSMLTGAISGAIALGVVGLGIALASQFEEVQTEAVKFGRSIRRILVTSAQAFGPEIIRVFRIIESRILDMSGVFRAMFDKAAQFVVPLTNALLDAMEAVVDALASVIVSGELDGFVRELADGFRLLGRVIGEVIRQLARTGKDGQSGLKDLFSITAALIGAFGGLLVLLTKVMGVLRQIAVGLGRIVPWVGVMQTLANKILTGGTQQGTTSMIETNFDLEESFMGLISATDGETKALEEYGKALEDASDAARTHLELTLDWEESLDRISAALKENGKTLDVTTEKGRENVRAFISGLEIAERRAIDRVKRGELTADQAAAQYQKEINQLRILARQAGIAESTFNSLFGEIINTAALNISAQEMGITDLNGELNNASAGAARLLERLEQLQDFTVGSIIGAFDGDAGVRGFADGGIVNFPQRVNVAEGGLPEVIVPLTKPARAAQLLEQSGLSAMLSGGPAQVLVFIGNEQLDSRMVRIVERNNSSQALALTHGGRS